MLPMVDPGFKHKSFYNILNWSCDSQQLLLVSNVRKQGCRMFLGRLVVDQLFIFIFLWGENMSYVFFYQLVCSPL